MKPTPNTATKVIYWGSTILFSLMMLGAAYAYLTSDAMAKGFVHLGFPSYFRVELAIAKFLGIAVLLAPLPQGFRRLKEWAYAGFTITVVSAFIAHTSVDGVQTAVAPLVALAILLVSYVCYHRMAEQGSVSMAEHRSVIA